MSSFKSLLKHHCLALFVYYIILISNLVNLYLYVMNHTFGTYKCCVYQIAQALSL